MFRQRSQGRRSADSPPKWERTPSYAPGAPREACFEGLLEGIAEDQRAKFMLKLDTYWV